MKQILYFSASWCQPCRTLAPTMESLKNQINYNKFDVDDDLDMTVRYKVRGVPTLILIENGIEKNRLTGVRNSAEILEFYNG